MPKSDAEYLTVKAACQVLGVSPNTLRSWGAAGKVTEYRHPLNNYRLFQRVELETLKERLRHPEAKTTKAKPTAAKPTAAKPTAMRKAK